MRFSYLLFAFALPGAAWASGGAESKLVQDLSVEWQAERLSATGDRGEHAACDPPFEEERTPFLGILEAELGRYPRKLWGRAHLRRIVLCRDLAVRFDKPVERSVNNISDVREEQPVTAFASARDGSIYVDVARILRSADFAQRLVHHEVFHFLDRAAGGRHDAAWIQDGHYGSGGINMQDEGGLGTLREGLPGFITPYAQASLEEDKAEVFCHLVTEGSGVRAMAAKDPQIAAKIGVLQRILKELDPALLKLIGG
ncbi:MAG: hypothetical protein U1E65_13085 [Myxococcota bacterium]